MNEAVDSVMVLLQIAKHGSSCVRHPWLRRCRCSLHSHSRPSPPHPIPLSMFTNLSFEDKVCSRFSPLAPTHPVAGGILLSSRRVLRVATTQPAVAPCHRRIFPSCAHKCRPIPPAVSTVCLSISLVNTSPHAPARENRAA